MMKAVFANMFIRFLFFVPLILCKNLILADSPSANLPSHASILYPFSDKVSENQIAISEYSVNKTHDIVFDEGLLDINNNYHLIPHGFQIGEDASLKVSRDPFGNFISAWISNGIVKASIKPFEGDWQFFPDHLSSINEEATDLHLSVDSFGNAFIAWQALPFQSIYAACWTNGMWEIKHLTAPDEKGCIPQIAGGSADYATAVWNCSYNNDEQDLLRILEIPLPLIAFREETPSLCHSQKEKEDCSTRFRSSHKLANQLPSQLPFPPTHLKGHQESNEFAYQTDLINIITWHAARQGPSAAAFYIYRDSHLRNLAAIIPANKKLEFKDHNRKSDHFYAYYIVAVDSKGIQSPPAIIIFNGPKAHVVKFKTPVSISIIPENSTIAVGSTQQFFAVVTFSDGTVRKLTHGIFSSYSDSSKKGRTFAETHMKHFSHRNSLDSNSHLIWNSSNTNIATIDAEGLAIGLSPGITQISATFERVSASTELTVTCTSPIITTQPVSQSVCIGSNLTFTVAAVGCSLSYQWEKNGIPIAGATSPTLTLNGVSLTDAGSYNVVVSNFLGSVVSNAATLSVEMLPTITVQPVSQIICAGSTVTFFVTASSGSLSYQWLRNGVPIPGATSATLILTNVQTSDSGAYAVVISNSCSSIHSNTASLTVNPQPAITIQPEGDTTCVGAMFVFSVTATGGPLTYQWFKNGAAIPGEISPTLTLMNVQLSDGGSYTVSVSNSCGTVVSNSAVLIVEFFPEIIVPPADQAPCIGSTATFSVTAIGGNLTYQWYKNGLNPIPGATSSVLIIPNVQSSDDGNYFVQIINRCGNLVSGTANLTAIGCVPGAPTSVTATAGNNSATVSFSPPLSDGGSPITNYTVTSSPGGMTASGTSSPILVTGLTNGTTYTFTVTATNIIGTGPASPASNPITPP